MSWNRQVVYPDIGGDLAINTSTDFTLTNANAESYIVLGGHLYEDDFTNDENLGFSERDLYLAEFNETIIALYFNGDGDWAEAHFIITPLDK